MVQVARILWYRPIYNPDTLACLPLLFSAPWGCRVKLNIYNIFIYIFCELRTCVIFGGVHCDCGGILNKDECMCIVDIHDCML